MPREDKSDVVGLLLSSDPASERLHDLLGNCVERQMPVTAHDLEQTVLAKFTELIFRLRDSVTVGDEDVTEIELFGALLVAHVVDEADDGSSAVEAGYGVVGAQQERWKLASG